jgi:crotonobetainyl-CoA:carnitine CoA-transferase CaiB-like acyl-CoA transferase
VLDISTVIAGPSVAAHLGDFGADVIKVEHPSTGDTTRNIGWRVGDHALWWKTISRNKRPITLNLSVPRGQELLIRLARDADILVESFRPGTLERWNLAPERLLAENPQLVIVRCSGFGQDGPNSRKPGFGSLAEAMSGYAGITGFPDGPPQLPPIALADEVAGLFGTIGALVALYHRDSADGTGQVVDLSLYESLFSLMGPLPAVYQQLGIVPSRVGSRMPYAAPRNTYETKDERWVAVSGTSQSIALRILNAIGRPELCNDPRFATNAARIANVDELDAIIQAWMSKHDLDEVIDAFERHEAAAFPVYDFEQIFTDPHYEARDEIDRVPDEDLGHVAMAAVHPRLSATPGRIRWAGQAKGAWNREILQSLGFDDDEIAELEREGVV